MNDYEHSCEERNAERFADWIENRGGVAVWESINLSNIEASWSTPALTKEEKPYEKPNWQCTAMPQKTITDPDKIEVIIPVEVKRFHVAVRIGGQGFSIKVSDGGTRRIHKEVEKAGEGAYYAFDYDDYDNAVIMKPGDSCSLTEWKEKQCDGQEAGVQTGVRCCAEPSP